MDTAFVDSFRKPLRSGNRVQDFHPILMLLMLASIAVIGLAVPGVIASIVACAAFVAVSFIAGLGRKFSALYAKLFLAAGVLLFVLRAALLPGTDVVFKLGPITVTTEGITEGLRFALVVMTLCGMVALFFLMVPMKNLTLALEVAGVSPRVSYVVLASFQAITDLGKNSKVVLDAQKARGVETDGSIFKRAKAFVPVLAPTFLAAMNQTEERALALDARAFNSRAAHTHLVELPPVGRGQAALAVVAALGALLSVLGAVFLWS